MTSGTDLTGMSQITGMDDQQSITSPVGPSLHPMTPLQHDPGPKT
jgi:hypothetical protein